MQWLYVCGLTILGLPCAISCSYFFNFHIKLNNYLYAVTYIFMYLLLKYYYKLRYLILCNSLRSNTFVEKSVRLFAIRVFLHTFVPRCLEIYCWHSCKIFQLPFKTDNLFHRDNTSYPSSPLFLVLILKWKFCKN